MGAQFLFVTESPRDTDRYHACCLGRHHVDACIAHIQAAGGIYPENAADGESACGIGLGRSRLIDAAHVRESPIREQSFNGKAGEVVGLVGQHGERNPLGKQRVQHGRNSIVGTARGVPATAILFSQDGQALLMLCLTVLFR